MKSFRVTFPGERRCTIEEHELPARPGPGQLMVKNVVSLISPGTEMAIYQRTHRAFSDDVPSQSWVGYPAYPGYSAIGVIEAVGDDVRHLRPGDTVWHPGAHANRALADAGTCHVVPKGVDERDAAFFALVRIALAALRRAPAQLGERTVVSGQGIIGLLCALLYQVAGADVTVADVAAEPLDRARRLGLRAVDVSAAPLPAHFGDDGLPRPQLVIEAAGMAPSIDSCLKTVAPGGRVVLLGSPRHAMTIDPYSDIHVPGITVIGAHMNTVPEPVRRADVDVIFELCRSRLPLADLRSREVDFRSAPEVYRSLDLAEKDHPSALLTYP